MPALTITRKLLTVLPRAAAAADSMCILGSNTSIAANDSAMIDSILLARSTARFGRLLRQHTAAASDVEKTTGPKPSVPVHSLHVPSTLIDMERDIIQQRA